MTDRLDPEQVVDLPLVPGRRRHERSDRRIAVPPRHKCRLDDVEGAMPGKERANDRRAVVLRRREQACEPLASGDSPGNDTGELLRGDQRGGGWRSHLRAPSSAAALSRRPDNCAGGCTPSTTRARRPRTIDPAIHGLTSPGATLSEVGVKSV